MVRVKGYSNDATIVLGYGKDATILTDLNIILRVVCGKTSSKRVLMSEMIKVRKPRLDVPHSCTGLQHTICGPSYGVHCSSPIIGLVLY